MCDVYFILHSCYFLRIQYVLYTIYEKVKAIIILPLNLLKPTGYVMHQQFNPLNAELNPICHLLALLGAHHFLHVSRIRVNTSAHCTGRKQVKG